MTRRRKCMLCKLTKQHCFLCSSLFVQLQMQQHRHFNVVATYNFIACPQARTIPPILLNLTSSCCLMSCSSKFWLLAFCIKNMPRFFLFHEPILNFNYNVIHIKFWFVNKVKWRWLCCVHLFDWVEANCLAVFCKKKCHEKKKITSTPPLTPLSLIRTK